MVTAIEEASALPALFEVPEGYKEVPPPPWASAGSGPTPVSDPLFARDRAWALVTEHVQSESLRKHLLAVEAAVRGYARMWGEDEDAWGFVALVHDFDYEKYPDRENHPFRGVEILQALGYPGWVTRAILSHADYSGVAAREPAREDAVRVRRDGGLRHRRRARAAVEERPRPRGVVGDQADEGQGVRARRAARGSAAGRRGDRLPLDEHITNVIGFLRERADELGLRGQPATVVDQPFSNRRRPVSVYRWQSLMPGRVAPSAC